MTQYDVCLIVYGVHVICDFANMVLSMVLCTFSVDGPWKDGWVGWLNGWMDSFTIFLHMQVPTWQKQHRHKMKLFERI